MQDMVDAQLMKLSTGADEGYNLVMFHSPNNMIAEGICDLTIKLAERVKDYRWLIVITCKG